MPIYLLGGPLAQTSTYMMDQHTFCSAVIRGGNTSGTPHVPCTAGVPWQLV
jgi:hypothetical protein